MNVGLRESKKEPKLINRYFLQQLFIPTHCHTHSRTILKATDMASSLVFLLVAILLSSFQSVSGQSVSCRRDNQCNDVTLRRDFVSCINNQCVCATTRGFSGNATITNKCRCVAPSNIYRIEGGDTYCYVIGDALAYREEKTREDFQTSVVRSVYNGLLWPAPRDIMIALITGQPTIIYNYFADNAKGRVDPVGTFSDHDGIVEYFYGLTWTGATKISQVIFKKLISQNNIVHSNVVLTFNLYDQTQQNILFTYNLTQSGSFTFDANQKIASADLIIHNLGQISDPQSPRTPEFINTVCYLILNVANCNATYDPLGYYVDFPDCVQQFNLYQWGSMDNVYFNGNTSICRFFHSLLAIGRPQVHCSHSGKTGGGNKCVSHDYSSYYAQDYKRKRAIVATMLA